MSHAIRALAFSLLCAAAAAGRDGPAPAAQPVPLNDLGPAAYQGWTGGLYPDGANMPPGRLHLAGLQRAARVLPLDRAGRLDPEEGRIGLLVLGTGATRPVAEELVRLADDDGERNAAVVTVNGATGGSLRQMRSPGDRSWSLLGKQLARAGLGRAQVQVVWLDATGALADLPFPDDARLLQRDLDEIVKVAQQQLPSLRLVFVSSGAYGGYAGARGELDSYESGFGVKWLVEERAAAGGAGGPWVGWGPYLWAEGESPRSDLLSWRRGDFAADGERLSKQGSVRAAGRLLEFLHVDAQARSWYLAQPGALCERPALVSIFGARRVGQDAPRIAASALPTLPAPEPLAIAVSGAPAGARGMFLAAIDPSGAALLSAGRLLLDPARVRSVPVLTDASGRARLELGSVRLPRETFCGRTLCVQFVCETDGALAASPGLRLQAGH